MKLKNILILVVIVAIAVAIAWLLLSPNYIKKSEELSLQLVASGFTAPLKLVSAPDATDRLFVAEQTGLVKIIKNGEVQAEPFLDLREKMVQVRESYDERGLLGMAFSPNFTSDGKFYVYYSAPLQSGAPAGWDHTSHVSVFTVDKNNPDKIDSSSEKVLLEIDEPQLNHNGGEIIFGSDGYLYIGVGDGGNADDFGLGHNEEIGNGQDLNTLLGKILRIKADGSIPEDNPFVGKDGRDEIYAYGFRNPFRMSFDENGRLFVADVGQNLWEEVDIVEKGKNYGWNIKEGTYCFSHESPNSSPAECANTGYLGEELVNPILEYNHQQGISIIGGLVKNGKYIFGDWSMSFEAPGGKIIVAEEKDGKWQITQTKNLDLYVLALGQDEQGELYVLTAQSAGPSGAGGQVWKLNF